MSSISVWGMFVSIIPYLLCIIFLLILIEQFTCIKKKKSSPGPQFILPFFGDIIQLVRNPTKFWDDQLKMGFSTNYIILLVASSFSFKILNFLMKSLQMSVNNIDISAAESFQILPTKLYLLIYSLQQTIILEHLTKWVNISIQNGNKPLALRFLCRDMNLETYQSVFVGPYLNEKSREKLNIDYDVFNEGTMALPIDLPGFYFEKLGLQYALNHLVLFIALCTSVLDFKRHRTDGCDDIVYIPTVCPKDNCLVYLSKR
ncbi:hypothetical protein C5167_044996 [Papaver somniferum]|uniref:Uncharacterized protein n=1 Tax=Papaver somniferum TaxID=3469 RepID=A0A4Y7LDF5_PAPSO|nr:hypothetical protein C5167_044996 [Papaver somniferum]